MASNKLKLPSGLAIARSGSKFACSWKVGANYSKVLFQSINSNKWSKETSLSNNSKAKTFTVDLSKYYPHTLSVIKYAGFRLRVQYSKVVKSGIRTTWSESQEKRYSIDLPAKPSVSATPSEDDANVCTFGWSVDTSNAHKILVDVEWQSIFVTESNVTNGAKLSWKSTTAGWQTGTGSASGSKPITETTSSIASGSHTRWFRARGRGPSGPTDWVYAKRVYAAPNKSTVTSSSITDKPSGGSQVMATFTAQYSEAYPIDYSVVEYIKDTPAANMTEPQGDSWDDGIRVKTINKTNTVSFPYSQTIEADKALFVRVTNVHGKKETNGPARVVKYGALDTPEDLNVTTNPSNYQATIEATNTSSVPGAMLAVCYRDSRNPNTHTIIGIIPNGQTTITNVQCPNWSGASWYKFGVYAFVGTYKSTPRADGVASYAITKTIMRSSGILWQSGTMPVAPTSVAVQLTDIPGTVKLTWAWSWSGATAAELSWANHADAWQSTEEPETYRVTSLNASEWNISGLETGITWYFRVRLMNDEEIYSPWSEIVEIIPSSSPNIPVLTLSAGIITADETVTASWIYASTDGTPQATADICQATISGGVITYGTVIASAETEQTLTLSAVEESWSTGELIYLCVRTVSKSGRPSEWSAPVPLMIAEPLQAVIASTSLTNVTVVDDDETGTTRTVLSLTEMPMEMTITGAGTGGTTMWTIERAADYHGDRPDESTFNGFEGETIAQGRQTGEDAISITLDDLYGSFDEGAQYRLLATVLDGMGRSSTVPLDFEVHWASPAIIPEGTAEMLGTAVKIIPIAPEGWVEGDTCDIYRLSADKPQLIVEGATFGTPYVDPFPAIGENGGHRIVYKTADGNYITADKTYAWIDLDEEDGDRLDAVYSIVDFEDGQISLLYDSTQSSSWEKDFQSTRYLGGSIQGDWNKGVILTSSLDVSMVTVEDQESMLLMRRLADYPGICHIRTVEGSSYPCDIQVNDTRHYDRETIRATYSLSITRVDSEALDGMTYEEWTNELE